MAGFEVISGVKLREATPNILEMYNKMKSNEKYSQRDIKMSIMKSTKVYPEALTETLSDHIINCTDPVLVDQLRGLIVSVQAMPADGKTKLFAYHMADNQRDSRFAYFCVAVQKYKSKGREVLNYCLSTYDFKQINLNISGRLEKTGLSVFKVCQSKSSKAGAVIGTSLMALGMLLTIAYGKMTIGIASIVVGAGIVSVFIGKDFFYASSRVNAFEQRGTTISPESVNDNLKACFIYELVNNGDAFFKNNDLTITEIHDETSQLIDI